MHVQLPVGFDLVNQEVDKLGERRIRGSPGTGLESEDERNCHEFVIYQPERERVREKRYRTISW